MKSINLILFFILIVQTIPIRSQSNADYFPYKIGDMWEYTLYDWPYIVDTVQAVVLNDSMDETGNIYTTIFARDINPIGPPSYGFWDTTAFELDKNLNVFGYDLLSHHWANLYRLNGKSGDQWVMWGGSGGYTMARIVWIKDTLLFGATRKLMLMDYYGTPDSTDTTGLDWYRDQLLKEIGLFHRSSAELSAEIYLHGAVIDSILYGDTTQIITSVKNVTTDNNILNDFKIFPNYPNPFNSTTKIPFYLKNGGEVASVIYDITGKIVKKIVENKYFTSGYFELSWDGTRQNGGEAASGVYFCIITVNGIRKTRSMILLK